jgi:hypothetical protein
VSAEMENVVDGREDPAASPPPGASDGDSPSVGPGPAGDRAGRGNVLVPLTRYLSVATVLMVTVWFSANHLRRNLAYPVVRPIGFLGDFLVEGWMRWDGGWYVNISGNGYSYTPGAMSTVAFFPAYPLAMRVVQLVVPDPAHVLPGIIVTFLAGLGAAVVFYRWCCGVMATPSGTADADADAEPAAADVAEPAADADAEPAAGAASGNAATVAGTAVLVLLLFPYAWYLYGAVYADALFLLSVVSAFVLLERDRPVLAGIVAIVATAGRPVGTGVVLGLVAVVLERRGVLGVPFLDRVRERGWRAAASEARARAAEAGRPVVAGIVALRVAPARLRRGDAGVLLSLIGLSAWMWYLQATFGDALLFIRVQSAPGWAQPQGPHTWFKVTWLANLRHLPEYLLHPDAHWDALVLTLGWTFQALLVAGALCLIPAVIRRFGWGYAVYVLGVLAIPLLGSKDWQGTGRYLLAAFPVFMVAAGWLVERPPALRWTVLATSGVVLVLLTSSFARGFYLA